ncbi:MAG: hypothetical protein A4E53_03171 [Pelotomaculum sp. PtaB.Bin104]|nr:MAG: hypothetical protein A4E53_03171 [Pelotomaculum sp. PtaB.Bin104]
MTTGERLEKIKQEYPDLIFIGNADCVVCGLFESYYQDYKTGIYIRTCAGCDYIQVVELEKCEDIIVTPAAQRRANDNSQKTGGSPVFKEILQKLRSLLSYSTS